MDYQDRLTIYTPEGVSLDLSLAGIGLRAGATVIDLIIRLVVFVAAAVALNVTGSDIGFATGLVLFIVFNFVLVFGYDVAFETLNAGRTPGKIVMGIRVMGKGGEPVGFVASAIRNLLRLIDFLPAGYVVGMVAATASSANQRLGDLAASTIVVLDPRPRTSEAEPPLTMPDGVADGWDVSAVSDEELATIRTYLARRNDLDRLAADRLAVQLRARLEAKVVRPPQSVGDVAFLRLVEQAKLRRR